MQTPESGEVIEPAIQIDEQSYPVLNRWLSLSSSDFKEELDELVKIGRSPGMDPMVQGAVASAVNSLAQLYRHRAVLMSEDAKPSLRSTIR